MTKAEPVTTQRCVCLSHKADTCMRADEQSLSSFLFPVTQHLTKTSLLNFSASEMTFIVSGGALNSTHSLISSQLESRSYRGLHWCYYK